MTSITSPSSTIVSGPNKDGVVIQGYLKKLKTMKRKYFVLYEECGKFKARLEYFDNDKKFKSKSNPKRIIMMDKCFNINRRLDTKHDYVITLSITDGGFGIVMDTEEDMNVWLKALLKVQNSGPPKPYYDHVWQVVVQRKGLAEKKGIVGSYHVCLSSKSLTLIRIGSERTNLGEQRVGEIEFYLTSIRRCGDSKCFFYMEVGRHSVIGAGELWMETKDSRIAQNMHTMILNVMSSNADDSYGPMRKRSSSATESSKPVAILQRRQTHSGSKTLTSSPLGGESCTNRDRCDSLPSSRNRATSESSQSFGNSSMPPSRTTSSLSTVSNTVYNRQSHSPPMIGSTLTPSIGCSESDGSTLSIDEPDSMKHSFTPDESIGFVSSFYNSRSPGDVIPEENADEYFYTDNKKPGSFENPSVFDKLNIHTGTQDSRLTFTCSSNNNIEYPESQYMEMGSSISPCETALGESPSTGPEYTYRNCNESSDGNSRASSLAEEVVDGYVHMSSPPSSDYVDMEESIKSRRQAYSNLSAPPMRGMSFAEYPVEKVHYKHFSDEDELHSLNEARPPRAYSVGSRVEHNNKKLRIEVLANADQNNHRVRAFSVGSRSKVPRCDLQRSILLSNAKSCNSNGASIGNSKTSIASMEPNSEIAGRGRKSSSAPLLIQKSQNSVDRMDDLMEIDFSKNSSSRSNSLSSQSPGASSSYLPKASTLRSSISNNSKGQNAPVATAAAANKKSNESFAELKEQPQAENGYLEMRPVIHWNESDEPVSRISELSNTSLPEISETRQLHSDHPTHKKQNSDEWTKVDTPEGYLEMSWNGNKDNSNRAVVEQPSTTKSRSPSSLVDVKKYGGITKMPSIISSQALANRSIHPNSKQSTHSNQKNTSNALGKPDNSQRKRFFDHVNSSFTISEEKTSSIDQDSISEKFNDLFIQQSSQHTNDLSNIDKKTSFTADSVSPDYVNFTPVPAQQISSPKKANNENEAIGKEKKRQSQSKEKRSSFDNSRPESKGYKIITSYSQDSPADNGNKPARKSNSPTCTPTSPFSSTSRCHRLNNANRQAKNTQNTNSGYELLHICSDSSLQTKKNVSRPSSVNSDRIFPLENNVQSRPNSVNNDCTQTNSIMSLVSPKNCDNRSQEQLLNLKPVPMNNNTYTDDNKPPGNNSPVSKIVDQCQPPSQLELHYASLDLPVSSTKNSNTTIHGSLNNPNRSSLSDDTATSLSPNSTTSQQSAFTYAKIGFIQCENKKLKCITQPNV